MNARSKGRRAAMNGKPNAIPRDEAPRMTRQEVFEWRAGYSEYGPVHFKELTKADIRRQMKRSE